MACCRCCAAGPSAPRRPDRGTRACRRCRWACRGSMAAPGDANHGFRGISLNKKSQKWQASVRRKASGKWKTVNNGAAHLTPRGAAHAADWCAGCLGCWFAHLHVTSTPAGAFAARRGPPRAAAPPSPPPPPGARQNASLPSPHFSPLQPVLLHRGRARVQSTRAHDARAHRAAVRLRQPGGGAGLPPPRLACRLLAASDCRDRNMKLHRCAK